MIDINDNLFELDLDNIRKDKDGTIVSAKLKGISMVTNDRPKTYIPTPTPYDIGNAFKEYYVTSINDRSPIIRCNPPSMTVIANGQLIELEAPTETGAIKLVLIAMHKDGDAFIDCQSVFYPQMSPDGYNNLPLIEYDIKKCILDHCDAMALGFVRLIPFQSAVFAHSIEPLVMLEAKK